MTVTPDASLWAPVLNVHLARQGPWLTLSLHGELDIATAPILDEQLDNLTTIQARPFVALEMSQLTFCDSSGLNSLVRLWKRVTTASGQLVLLRPTFQMIRVLRITGLEHYFGIYDELPEDRID